jgi:hypothetical protein
MASYEEYANRQPRDPATGQFVADGQLEGEIQEAAEAQVERNIPESVANRFAGKSVDEVLESYAALESKLGSQGEEIGQLRRMQEQMVELQIQQARQPQVADTAEPVEPITANDLYDDPDEAIGRVVETKAKSQLEPIQRELAELRLERTKARLESQFPSWESEVRSSEFLDWVKESSFRSRMAQEADRGDIEVATDLLSDWYAKKGANQEQERQEIRNQQLEDASLVESSPAPLQSEPGFKKADLQDMRGRAHQGDVKARDWLNENSEAIRLAYAEGRVT